MIVSALGIKTARTVDWGTITSDGYTLPYEYPLNYLELPVIRSQKRHSTN